MLILYACQTVVSYIYLFVKVFGYIGMAGVEALNAFDDPEQFDKIYKYLEESAGKDALLLTLICNVVLIAILLIFYIKDKNKWDVSNPLNKNAVKNPLSYVLTPSIAASSCLFFNILVSIVATLAISVMGNEIMDTYNNVATSIYTAPALLQFFMLAVSAPICEELLMRGIIYKRLRSYSKPFVAALISAILFGAIHGNWVQFVYAFAVGLVAAYIYEYTHNLFAPILFHMVTNATSFVVSLEPIEEAVNLMMYGEALMPITLVLCAVSIVTGLMAIKQVANRSLIAE